MLSRAERRSYDVAGRRNEVQGQVSGVEPEGAETLSRDLRSASQKQDHEGVGSLMSEWESLSYRITEQLYQRVSSEAGSTTSTNTPPPGGDDVIDAEYREER